MKKIYPLTLFFVLLVNTSTILPSITDLFTTKSESGYVKKINKIEIANNISAPVYTPETISTDIKSRIEEAASEVTKENIEQNLEETVERTDLGDIEPLSIRKPLPFIKTIYNEMDFYKYDSVANAFVPKLDKSSELLHKIQAFGFDPVRFRIHSNKDYISINEEIEITITAEFLDVSPQLIFTFEGANEYTLKMLMPKGFVQTGGTYYDFITGKVSRDKPKEQFTIKGRFEYAEDKACFSLLRSHANANTSSIYIKKGEKCLSVNTDFFTIAEPTDKSIQTTTFTINNSSGTVNIGFCEDLGFELISCVGTVRWQYKSVTDTDWTDVTNVGDQPEFTTRRFVVCTEAQKETIYRARCTTNGNIEYSNEIKTVFSAPAKPTINLPSSVSAGTPVTGFISCGSHKVRFKSGNNWTLHNSPYNINEVLTSSKTYEATCTDNGNTCIVCIESKTVVIGCPQTIPTPTITQTSPVGIVGYNATLSLKDNSSCPNGTFKWYNNSNSYQSSGISGNFSEGTYKVRCEINGCTPGSFSNEVNVVTNGAPTLETTTTVLCSSEAAVLTAERCHANATARFDKFNGSTWTVLTSNTVTAGTYRAVCILNGVTSNSSNHITITDFNQTIGAPSVSIKDVTGTSISTCGKDGSATLIATGCSGGTINWNNGQTGGTIIITASGGAYSATCTQYCGSTPLVSSSSSTLTVNYQAICDCNNILISTNTVNDQIYKKSTLVLSVPEIEGATYRWHGPNIPASVDVSGATLTIPNISLANSGDYSVLVSCRTTYVHKYITVTDVDECANDFFHFAYGLSPNGQVGVGDELGLVADGGDKYEWTGPNGFYSTNQFPSIKMVTLANSGYYTVKISKLIDGVWCDKFVGVEVKISNCNFDVGPTFNEESTTFQLNMWSNKPLEGATFEWLKGSTTVSTLKNPTFAKNPANTGTYTLKVNLRGCLVEKSIKIDYVSPPLYDGHLDISTCEEISGWIIDENNKNKSLPYVIKVKIDNDERSFTLRSDGGGGYIRFRFTEEDLNKYEDLVLNLRKYKDGLPHTVIVYLPDGTPLRNTFNRSFRCCSLDFEEVKQSLCVMPEATANISIKIKDNIRSGLQYYLEKQERDEDGNTTYKSASTWQAPTTTPTSYTFTNLATGVYRVTAREGSDGCTVKTGVSIFCEDTPGCNNTNVVVFPSGEIREGIGIIPKLYANVQPEKNASNPPRGGLELNGDASVSIGDYNYMFGNFTLEAWVNPRSSSSISVGEAGDGSRQRYLFKSWNGAKADRAAAQLSVGSNGINLIEEGDNYRRVALSYEGIISGWSHIAVVYRSNMPTLLINGQVVASSTITPPSNIQVVGPNSVGTDRGKGFVGSVYGFRVWTAALDNAVVNQHKTNFDPLLAAYPNVGFWVFDKLPTGNYIEDLSSHKRQAKLEGKAIVLIPPTPIVPPNAPVLTWWLDNLQVGTGNTYTVPANRVRAGTLNYVVRYQKKDGTYCSTAVPIVIAPANYGSLSGCYVIKSTESNAIPIAPYYDPTTTIYTIKKGFNGQGSEKEIWRLEHLGSEIYRINSAFFNDMALEGAVNEVTLKARRTNDPAQQWKANVVNAAAHTFSLVPQNNLTKRLHYDGADNSTVTLSANNGTSENFILQPTACPLPPGECNPNLQITYERWLEPSLQTMPSTQFNSINVAQYITDNPNPYAVQAGLQNISLENTTSNNFPGKPGTWPGNRYINRISGYLCAPKNGDYSFYIKTKEWAQLWMSTDEDRTHKRLIAQCTVEANSFDARLYEQRSVPITLTKGRSYYFEVILKNESNTLNTAIAWAIPDVIVNESQLTAMPLTNISSIPTSITPSILTVSASSLKVNPAETVTLTASGCNYGRVIWKAGLEVVQNPNSSMPVLARQGPGIYQAMCIGDYTVNQDWVVVKVDPNVEITPGVNPTGVACTNKAITLTATNLPANTNNGSSTTTWNYQWFKLKTDATSQKTWREQRSSLESIFDQIPGIFDTGNNATFNVTGPGTYYVRIVNNNGYKSPIKEYTVEPAIPAIVKATNDSPTPTGNPLVLTATDIAGATYAWTGPNFTASTRAVTRTNFDASMAGIYTVTITTAASAGGCSVTATTEVIAANCDIYIKATNPANNEETYSLPRKVGVAGEFNPLTLKIENLDGTTGNFSPYNIQWMLNGNPMAGAPNAATLSTDKIGEYVAILSLKTRPENTCEARVNINAIPCKVYDQAPTCGTAPSNIEIPSTTTAGINLAPGDIFTVADYTVVVTEITSGSAGGWNGKGYIEFRLIGDIAISQVSVILENAVINECYQLAGGKVITEYDPNWGNILDIDEAIATIKDIRELTEEVFNWGKNFTGTPEDCDFIKENLPQLKSYVNEIQESTSFTSEQIRSSLNKTITGLENVLSQNCSCSITNGRVINTESSCSVNIENAKNGLNETLILLGGSRVGQSQYSSLAEFFASPEGIDFAQDWINFYMSCKDYDFAPYNGGIVPYCFWKNGGGLIYSGNDVAFLAGFLDAAYITYKGTTEFPKTLAEFEQAWVGSLRCKIVGEEWKDITKLKNELIILGHNNQNYLNKISAAVVQYELTVVGNCIRYKDIRESTVGAVRAFKEILTDYTAVTTLINNLTTTIGKYLEVTIGTDSKARYNQGKLLFDIGSFFYGAEEVNFAQRVKNILNALPRITSQIDVRIGIAKLKALTQSERNIKIPQFKQNPQSFAEFIDNAVLPLFSLDGLRGLPARSPSGITRRFFSWTDIKNNSIKIKTNQETGLLKQLVDDIATNGDQTGSKTERLVDIVFSEHYDVLDGKTIGNQGYDFLGKIGSPPSEISIVEAKQFSNIASDGFGFYVNDLNSASSLPIQMSDAWINNVAQRLISAGKNYQGNLVLNNSSIIKKYGLVVNRNTKEIWIFKMDNF